MNHFVSANVTLMIHSVIHRTASRSIFVSGSVSVSVLLSRRFWDDFGFRLTGSDFCTWYPFVVVFFAGKELAFQKVRVISGYFFSSFAHWADHVDQVE